MTRNRLTRLAALSLCAFGVVATTPASADAADAAGTQARSGTGALTGKTLTARTTLTSTSGKNSCCR